MGDIVKSEDKLALQYFPDKTTHEIQKDLVGKVDAIIGALEVNGMIIVNDFGIGVINKIYPIQQQIEAIAGYAKNVVGGKIVIPKGAMSKEDMESLREFSNFRVETEDE